MKIALFSFCWRIFPGETNEPHRTAVRPCVPAMSVWWRVVVLLLPLPDRPSGGGGAVAVFLFFRLSVSLFSVFCCCGAAQVLFAFAQKLGRQRRQRSSSSSSSGDAAAGTRQAHTTLRDRARERGGVRERAPLDSAVGAKEREQ